MYLPDINLFKAKPEYNNNRSYRVCSVSVMDTLSDPNITFDDNGQSHYANLYKSFSAIHLPEKEEGLKQWIQYVELIKQNWLSKPYDCIVGVSGGIDSAIIVDLAKKYGLRPLLVHFDNGWNTNIAVNNIQKLISKTGFELYTYVVNWEEFKDIQRAYLKASVVDIEVPTDHAISAVLHSLALKYKISYILSGSNIVSEFVLPNHWVFNKADYVNLLNIHKAFGEKKLKTYPVYGFKEQYIDNKFNRLEIIKPLNLIEYDPIASKEYMQKEYHWIDYGGKHFESVFTKFYQSYILPIKFGIDKRKAHLSSLIFSGFITREDAINTLKIPPHNAETELKNLYDFVIKKLNFSEEEFDTLMQQSRIEHTDFGTVADGVDKHPFVKLFRYAKSKIK